jgi:N-acetylmuramoyl-L-alanine amidase
MDAPRNGEGLRGTVPLVGWVLAESGIKQVIVYVDRNYAATATLGRNRPDVARAYPAFSNRTDAGWAASLDTSKFRAGAHELVVQAMANNGAMRDLSSIVVSFHRNGSRGAGGSTS